MIRGLKEILVFQVSFISADWRFPDQPTQASVMDLIPDRVRRIQNQHDAQLITQFKTEHLLAELALPTSSARNRSSKRFKAFIGIASPEYADADEREFLQSRLREK